MLVVSYTFVYLQIPTKCFRGIVLTSNSQGRLLRTLGSTTVSSPRCLIAFAGKDSYEKWLIQDAKMYSQFRYASFFYIDIEVWTLLYNWVSKIFQIISCMLCSDSFGKIVKEKSIISIYLPIRTILNFTSYELFCLRIKLEITCAFTLQLLFIVQSVIFST